MSIFGNNFKTFFLLGLLTVIIMFFGQLLGGRTGLYLAFILAAGMNFFSYWFSDRVVLRLYRGEEAGPEGYAELHRLVENLSRRAGLPKPKIYIIPQDSPNAFATGRNYSHAALGVTRGLLALMSPEELQGVLAHEIGHIKNRDTLIGTVAATLAGVIMILANMVRWTALFGGLGSDDDEGGGIIGMLVAAFLAPFAAMIIQMAVSRSREYMADSNGARLAGQPFGLAAALEKLAYVSKRVPLRASEATSHLFIINPLKGTGFKSFFSTHPPIEDRIRRLRSMNY